jgi:uncharacterized protein YbaP (TraB family)
MATAYRNAFTKVNQTRWPCYPLWVTLLCLLVAAGAAAQGRFDSGLLWRIERAGSSPSYLFGTMHTDDPGVVNLAAPVRQAFDQADAVTLEVTLDVQSLLDLAQALLLNEGGTLDALLDAALYARAVEAMAGQGIPDSMVARMKPWAVAVTLMTPPTETGVVLDQVLYQKALADGKPVDGLETVAEQVGLFDSLTLEEQIELLQDTLDHLPEIERMLDEVRQAWLQRDLARLVEINAAILRDSDPQFAATFNQRIILDRNHRMVERMQARLRAGGRFIAVGALHLPGREGLLELLEQRGYRLTRLY